MEKQKTIAKEVSIKGIGLHTGNASKVTFIPAEAGYGIKFIRTDIKTKPVISASYEHVTGTAIRGTTIANGSDKVHTVEHILAVCSGLGIDNLEIHISNNEPPILDGSAKLFADLIKKAGLKELDAPKQYMFLDGPVSYSADKAQYTAYPADQFSIECFVEYDHPFVRSQKAEFTITPETFAGEIAPARTFCFDYEIEALKSKGLAKGGDLSNAIVAGINGIHNPEPLRFQNEFVLHKMLDLIGDLYLLGHTLKARVVASRCGHHHNIGFVKEISKALKIRA